MRKIAPGQVDGLQEITSGGSGPQGIPGLPPPAVPRPAPAYAPPAAAYPPPAAAPVAAPYAPPASPIATAVPAARVPGMAQPPSRGVIKQQVVGAYGQAKEILAVAEQEAARILKDAERIREEQARLGYDEGMKQGYEEALRKLGEIEEENERIFADLEPKLLELSVKVAEKIIGSELATRPDAMAAIVSQALKTVRHQKDINIRVHPSQVAVLEEHKKTLLGVLSRARDVTIRGDPNVREGGCVIETELGILDADLETQLEILERALGGGLPSGSGGAEGTSEEGA